MSRTQVAQRSASANAPLLLKFRVNGNYLESISDILEVRNRTKKEEYELTKKRVSEVGKAEAFVYERTDAAGNKQADTGTEMFFNGKYGNALTFGNFIDDLKDTGYNLVNLYSYQKKGDHMFFLCFLFNKEQSDGFPSKITHLLKKLTTKNWEHTHIWDNPDGSITVNAAHISQNQFPSIRIERTDEKGTLKCSDKAPPQEGIYFCF